MPDIPTTTAALNECRPACPACFMGQHEGHDLGLRHEGGSLYSATCHDCGVTFQRATKPMQEAIRAAE